MKKLFLLSFPILLGIILFSCQNKQSSLVQITGTITNPTADSVKIEIFKNNERIVLAQSPLDSNGNFMLSFDIPKPTKVHFNDMNETSSIFVKPGTQMNITLNTEAFDETIEIIGDLSQENALLKAFYLKFEDMQSEDAIDYYGNSRKMTSVEYFDFVDQKISEIDEFYNSAISENQYDSEFLIFANSYFSLIEPQKKVYGFYGYRPSDTLQENINARILEANNIIDSKSLIHEAYKDLGISLVQYAIPVAVKFLIRNEFPDLKSIDSLYYLRVSEILSEEELNLNIYNRVKSGLESFDMKAYTSKEKYIEQYLTNTEQKAELERLYNELKENLEAGYALHLNKFDFGEKGMETKTFEDILKPYKGKIIYLDVWASWCGPCKYELPYSHKLKEKLKGEEVEFVYLSTDRNKEAWENMLIMMQLEGEHYRVNKNIHKYLSEEYKLEYIPHYMIFDREGKLLVNNANRPSSEETEIELRNYLAQ